MGKLASAGSTTLARRAPRRRAKDTARPVASVVEYPSDPRRHFMHDGLQGLPPDSTLLALGCEQAFVAPQLLEYCGRVTVLDSCANEIAQLSGRFPEIAFRQHEPSSPLPFAAETFDAIWCCDFLDRVFDPLGALRELHRVLRPGGRLLIAVADGSVGHDGVSFTRIRNGAASANPPLHHFARPDLVRLVRDAGFVGIQAAAAPLRRAVDGASFANGAENDSVAPHWRGVPAPPALRASARQCLLVRASKGPSLRLGAASARRVVRTERDAAEDTDFAREARPAA